MMRCRRPLILTAVVVLAAFSLLAAGCGGSSQGVPSVASTTPAATTTTPTQNGLLAFSQCMRSHGLANFPDPQRFAGGNVKLTIHQVAAGNPHYQTAMNACTHLLPNRGGGSQETTRTQLADELSFARCMRSHGVTRFPDPTAQGDLSVAMVQAQGIDVHSPAVLRIVQTCLPASHGGLTAAKVREALNHVTR